MKFCKVLLAALVLASLSAPAQAYRWLPANGLACADVCSAARMPPIVSGVYRNGKAFSVCRADAGGEGVRPGYNLSPDWANACYVAWGGREQPVPRYECLCGQ